MDVGGQHHAPAALPPGKTRYPLYRRLGGPQGRSRRMRKISPPPVFDPRTVQHVASSCTDWAIPGHFPKSVFSLFVFSDPKLRKHFSHDLPWFRKIKLALFYIRVKIRFLLEIWKGITLMLIKNIIIYGKSKTTKNATYSPYTKIKHFCPSCGDTGDWNAYPLYFKGNNFCIR